MTTANTLATLGYLDSPHFLRPGTSDFEAVVGFGHVFRKAARDCGLKGVYVLRPSSGRGEATIPVVYVCEAETETEVKTGLGMQTRNPGHDRWENGNHVRKYR